MKHLRTTDEVIREVGGPTAFARWWGAKTSRVSMWLIREKFPAATYTAMSDRLRKDHNIEAPPHVWGQKS